MNGQGIGRVGIVAAASLVAAARDEGGSTRVVDRAEVLDAALSPLQRIATVASLAALCSTLLDTFDEIVTKLDPSNTSEWNADALLAGIIDRAVEGTDDEY